MKEKHTAIVLAAGSGKRMHSQVQKQYMDLFGKPVLYYALRQFEECEFIDEVILVTKKDEIAYCREKIVEVYHLQKVKDIIEGGEERYLSVYNALKAAGAKVEYIEFPGCNHGSWNPAFNYPGFMDWLFKQKKKR